MTPANAHGILLLDKPSGISSFAALYPVKRAFGGKKGAACLEVFIERFEQVFVLRIKIKRIFRFIDAHETGGNGLVLKNGIGKVG